MTVDLVPLATAQRAFIGGFDEERGCVLMEALDARNRRWRRGAVVPAGAGFIKRRGWSIKFQMPSPRYTTRVDERQWWRLTHDKRSQIRQVSAVLTQSEHVAVGTSPAPAKGQDESCIDELRPVMQADDRDGMAHGWMVEERGRVLSEGEGEARNSVIVSLARRTSAELEL